MKSTALSFEQYNDDDGQPNGIFVESDSKAWLDLQEEFYDIDDFSEYQDEYIRKLNDLLEREPFFLDAYAHIGGEYLDNGAVFEAEEYYQKGLDIALPLIPDNFEGAIPWAHLSNRPFLRLHHGYILCQIRQCRYKKAVRLMEQHLAWNPNDNIGVRYLIGEACLQAGFTGKAEKYLSENQNTYPPASYSLALLEFKKQNFINAATALRKGIFQNPYIAEIITGRQEPTPHLYWHGTNLAAPETAVEYMITCGYAMWSTTPEAVDFCDWLFNCSDILKERSIFTMAREGLTYERDFEKRGEYTKLESQAKNSIDNTLSQKLIRKVTDKDGNEKWPWQIKKHKPLG